MGNADQLLYGRGLGVTHAARHIYPPTVEISPDGEEFVILDDTLGDRKTVFRARLHKALNGAGFSWPGGSITVKEGVTDQACAELSVAIDLLALSGQTPPRPARWAFGYLLLDGEVKPLSNNYILNILGEDLRPDSVICHPDDAEVLLSMPGVTRVEAIESLAELAS